MQFIEHEMKMTIESGFIDMCYSPISPSVLFFAGTKTETILISVAADGFTALLSLISS